MKKKLGLVHVYTGNGKGKTSMSLGIALRAAGYNLNVHMIQFLKSGDTGELFAVENYLPNMKIAQFGKEALIDQQTHIHEFRKESTKKNNNGNYKFLPDEEEAESVRRAFEYAHKIATSGDHDVLILDEINCAVEKGLINIEEMLNLMKIKSENTELILTGRGAPKELIEAADYVTEMGEVKHPYNKKILAREGIDY
ncbi:cob(I)yrinic acid a,c-diamide adenosyltransferase [Candidatus Woesearchaeota archaeon]|nr:cob(I)yrinic acid a,c-diamide adenosyltransferase [Candidatus Woesearchaeota archaeon]